MTDEFLQAYGMLLLGWAALNGVLIYVGYRYRTKRPAEADEHREGCSDSIPLS